MKKNFIGVISILLSVFSLNAQLNPVWQRDILSPYPSNDQFFCDAYGITTNSNGESFVIGAFASGSGNTTNYIAKYSTTGTEAWRKYDNFPTPTSNRSFCSVKAVGNGIVYTGGTHYKNSTNQSFLIQAYNQSNGNITMTFIQDSVTAGSVMSAFDMEIDDDNNIYIGGVSTQPNLNVGYCFRISKISPNGNLLWTRIDTLDSPFSIYDENISLELTSNHIYIGGNKSNSLTAIYTPRVVKYDLDGNKINTFEYTDIQSTSQLSGFKINTSTNNVILTGNTREVGNTSAFAFTASFNPNGTENWVFIDTTYVKSANFGLGILPNGDIISFGYHDDGSNIQSSKFRRIAYRISQLGQLVWRKVYPSGQNSGSSSHFRNIEITANNQVYLAGVISEFQSYFTLTKINPNNGNEIAEWRKQISYFQWTLAPFSSIDSDGAIYYYAPHISMPSENKTNFLAKFSPNFLDIENAENTEISIFPNPTSGLVNIQLKNDSFKTMQILDINGKEIYTTVVPNTITQIDFSEITKGSHGIYFIIMASDESRIVYKLIYN